MEDYNHFNFNDPETIGIPVKESFYIEKGNKMETYIDKIYFKIPSSKILAEGSDKYGEFTLTGEVRSNTFYFKKLYDEYFIIFHLNLENNILKGLWKHSGANDVFYTTNNVQIELDLINVYTRIKNNKINLLTTPYEIYNPECNSEFTGIINYKNKLKLIEGMVYSGNYVIYLYKFEGERKNYKKYYTGKYNQQEKILEINKTNLI